MRLSLLLALAACNPAATPTASDAAAWRDVIDLGACRHQVARDPITAAPQLSWETCPNDPEPGCQRLVAARSSFRGPPRAHVTVTLLGTELELAGPSAGG